MSRSQSPLSTQERLAWLRLIRSENVGPVTFRQLLNRYGTASAALDALPALAQRGGRRRIRVCPRAEAEREVETLDRLGAELLAMVEPGYPPALAAIEDAPPLLSLKGHGHLLSKDAVAIVGARNASANGRRLAQKLAGDLGGAGFLVVSGLARGIDAAAHQGSLENGTAAIVAGGIDNIYPPENEALYHAIAEQGVLITEMPPGAEPKPQHFPRRNRIISGLSLGVVVVEAAPRSGSLITARRALDQGREVFAVPGSPLDSRARGCNDLIRQGAILTESAEDVLRGLEGAVARPLAEADEPDFLDMLPAVPEESELAAGRKRIEDLLSPTPVMVDELIRQCQLSPAVVNTVLLELELAGRLERHAGSRVSLIVDGPGTVK